MDYSWSINLDEKDSNAHKSSVRGGGASVAAEMNGAQKRADSRHATRRYKHAHLTTTVALWCHSRSDRNTEYAHFHSHHSTMQTCFYTQLSYFMVGLLQYDECKKHKNLLESHFMKFHQQDNGASPDIQSSNEDLLLDFATGENWSSLL